MKKTSPLFTLIFISVIIISVSCKKEKKEPEAPTSTSGSGVSGGASYKKIKCSREVSSTPSYTSYSTVTYNYSLNGNPLNIMGLDSSGSGSIWTVNTYTISFNFNSANRINQMVYSVPGSPATYIVEYVFDTNGKLQYEISISGSNVDSMTYSHNGNKTTRVPTYPPSSGYWKDYYTDGDLDSSVAIGSSPSSAKTIWNYSASDKDLSAAHFNKYLPLTPTGKQLDNVTNYNNGIPGSWTNYSYVKDGAGYLVKVNISQMTSGTFYRSYTYY